MGEDVDTGRSAGAEAERAPNAPPSFPGLERVELLGAGGMGTVFRAWQPDLERAVAVKTMLPALAASPAMRERFAREARILARLDHPGIVAVHYAGESAGEPYYVMRLVEGVDLLHHLARKPFPEIAATFRDVATALHVAHRAGVLHRDVKPENVLVEPDGRAVLVDFGLSAPIGYTAGPEIAGTLDFAAPEVLAGAGASVASEVYGLGATLYAALTGRAPFAADDLRERLRAIREDDPPLPRTLRADVPRPLQAICLKAIERAPADRYATAEELARDLDRFVKGDVVSAMPVRSRSLLRRKIELHLVELAQWSEQGLIDDRQRAALARAYEEIDERERGLMRGLFGSVSNLLLLVGILISVFGPVVLLLVTWREQHPALRVALPFAPLALLAGLGAARWRAQDRRRGVACLFGAALLSVPGAFVLADLAPALRTILDGEGHAVPILPGPMWLPPPESPVWLLAGARLLEWKILITAIAAGGVAIALHRATRAAAFLWIAAVAGVGAVVCGAMLAGWGNLPDTARFALAEGLGAALVALGIALERRFRGERADPFYGLGLAALIVASIEYVETGLPAACFGIARDGEAWSAAFDGLAFVAAGLAAHACGTPRLRKTAGLPLFVGFALTLGALAALASDGALLFEALWIAGCVAFLVLGVAIHRNSIVLPAALVLPIAVGSVSQRHVQALWAWSMAVVLGGAVLTLLGFRRRAE
jgi:serine/threonine-protein kinase